MDYAYFTMPLHPFTRDYTTTLKEDRAAIQLADRLGFAEAYIGEHVTDRAETITDCATFIASLIDSTKRIKLGTGTVNLPNNHPLQVAGTIAMLDHLLEGRFMFGISPGGLLSDAEGFGTLDQDRTAMLVESINHILALWTTEPPFDLKGKYWNISTTKTFIAEIGQGMVVRPYQKPHPPIVVTVVAPFSKGVVSAAERGWLAISANFLQPIWVKSHWPMYAEGRTKAGAVANSKDWRVARSIFVADDEATAQRYGLGLDGPYAHYFKSLMRKLISNGRAELFKNDRAMAGSAVTLDFVLETLVIAGTVNSVADQLLAFREITGDFGTLVYAGHDWQDEKLSRRSMELFATEVMPRLNRAIGSRSAAD